VENHAISFCTANKLLCVQKINNKYECTIDQELVDPAAWGDAVCALTRRQHLRVKWRHGRHLKSMMSYPKWNSVFTWRTILPNFIPIQFEMMVEPIGFFEDVAPTRIRTRTTKTTWTRWLAIWDQFQFWMTGRLHSSLYCLVISKPAQLYMYVSVTGRRVQPHVKLLTTNKSTKSTKQLVGQLFLTMHAACYRNRSYHICYITSLRKSMGRGVPSPAEGVWGSIVSSPSGDRGGAQAENIFGVFRTWKNTPYW